MAHDGHLVEIVHARPAEVAIGHRKARGLDNMGRHVKARTQAQDSPGVLGYIGLE